MISLHLAIRRAAFLGLSLCAVLVATASGCSTHAVLQRKTVDANFTMADMYYRQVLNNVARFEANPATMPSFSVISAGTVNIQDQQQANIAPTYSPTLPFAQQGGGALPILSILFGLNAQRAVTENWSTQPVTDSDNLRRMRCAFQYLVGTEPSECDRCKARLKGFAVGGTEPFDCMFPRGWYEVGCEKDVPENACHVASYCDKFVWVTPSGLDGFTRFTITVLDIATGEIHAPQRHVRKTYKGEPKPENLETTEITSTEVDKEALNDLSDFGLDRTRPEPAPSNRGLFFVPR